MPKPPGRLGRELLDAVGKGRVSDVVVALEEGADVNYASTEISTMKDTALMMAALNGRDEVVATLLERGADVHAKNYWAGTALHMACKRGQVSAIVLLRKAGAEKDRGDLKQKTPVDHAKLLKDPEVRSRALEALRTPKVEKKALPKDLFGRRRTDPMAGMRRARLAAERKTRPLQQWSAPCVAEWLHSLEYALPHSVVEAFEDNEVDGEFLAALARQDGASYWNSLDVLPKHRLLLTKTIREVAGMDDGSEGREIEQALQQMESRLESKLTDIQHTTEVAAQGVESLQASVAEMSAKLDRNFNAIKSMIDGTGAVPTLCFLELVPKEDKSLMSILKNPSKLGDGIFHQRFRLHFLDERTLSRTEHEGFDVLQPKDFVVKGSMPRARKRTHAHVRSDIAVPLVLSQLRRSSRCH